MITFKKIRFKNFLSFGDQFTEIVLNETMTTLITGKNGTGKSVFLDALTFVLYGKPFRKINKPQLVNSINKKACVVEIEFSTGKHEYLIRRGIKPNIFIVEEDGKELDQDGSVNDYQNRLERDILKMNYTAFTQIVILGKATYVPFMRLTGPERRQVIEDLLGLSVFSKMNKILKGKISSSKVTRTETEGLIRTIESEIMSQERFIQQQNLNRLENINRLKVIISQIQTSIDTSDERIADLEAQKKALREQKRTARESISRVQETADRAVEEAEKEQTLRIEMNEPDSSADVNAKIRKLRQQREKLKEVGSQLTYKAHDLSEIVKFLSENDTCPTCKQSIDEDFRREEVDKKKKKISELKDGEGKLIENLSSIDDQINSAENLLEDIAEQERILREADRKVQIAQSKVREAQSAVREEQAKVSALDSKIDSIDSGIETVRSSLGDSKKMIESHEEQIKTLEEYDDGEEIKKLDNKKEENASWVKKLEEIDETSLYYSAIAEMLKDSGIKTVIIKKYLPVFNKLINQYLNQMGFFIQFELDEEFNELILSRYRDKFSYASFSEGQKLRIDLAILLTWREIAKLKNSLNTNLLIMDEVFDSSLDQAGVDSFVGIIPHMEDANIFVVSHTPDKLFDRFDRRIQFDMESNFSRMIV